VPALEHPDLCPAEVVVELPGRYGLVHTPKAAPGDFVAEQQAIAESRDVVTHAPVAGTVREATPDRIVIGRAAGPPERSPTGSRPGAAAVDAAFLRDMGVVGMGGAMFPAARKFSSCGRIHTLVLNGVECEPGITIDRCLLEEAADSVRAGAEAMAAAVGAERIVLALGREKAFTARMRDRYPFDIVTATRPGRSG
jgi:electron transport complex protein RnfC